MQIGMENKMRIVNRFVIHTSHRNILNLAVITRKTKIKTDILNDAGKWKRAVY